MKIEMEWILDDICKDFLEKKTKYFNDSYNYILQQKKDEYIKMMKKKLKTERDVFPPF